MPATGDWLITDPAGTVVLGAVVTPPTVRPAFAIAVVAAACVRPTTLGVATWATPLDTTSATAEPLATCVPATGDWLITEPAGTVALDAVVIAPTVRPAPWIVVVAAACVRLTTLGTAMVAGGAVADTISIDARFQRSVAGAVSLIVATVPAAATGAERACTQNVSPTLVFTHSWTIVWLAPTVRGSAVVQSLPTP